MDKYNNFFIQTDKDGCGITVCTDARWELRMDDIYLNPYTGLALIEYLDLKGSMTVSRFVCNDFDSIKITKETK